MLSEDALELFNLLGFNFDIDGLPKHMLLQGANTV